MTFKGKLVVISGGASGIGQRHAIVLAEEGALVVILDIDQVLLRITAERSEGIIPYLCDVTSLEQVRNTVKQIITEHGPIDRFINCAAIMPGGLLMETSAELINKIIDINYCGMVNMCQTIIPAMLERDQGEVIIYGSTAGLMPFAKFGAYGVSKAANNFYTKVLIKETKKTKLRVLLVCPPAVDTPLLKQAHNGPDIFETFFFKKFFTATPERVVNAVEKSMRRGSTICFPGIPRLFGFIARLI